MMLQYDRTGVRRPLQVKKWGKGPLRIADRALGLALKVQRDIFLEKADRIDNPSILMMGVWAFD